MLHHLRPHGQSGHSLRQDQPRQGGQGHHRLRGGYALPGVSCGKHEGEDGAAGVPVSDIVLEDVRVGADCVIGEVDMGFSTP